MYNTTNSLPAAPPATSGSFFRLENIDTKKVVELLVQPGEQAFSFSADYSKISVLGSEQPFISYKNSEENVSIPDIKFWTYGNNKDLTLHLDAIASFTKPDKQSQEPPTVKLTMGTKVYERVKVTKFQYKVSRTSGGVPVVAEGSLDFILAPIPPEPTLAPATTKLSEPEKAKAVTDVTKLLDGDPKKATLYSYTKGKSVVTVADDGDVKIGETVIGKLADVLGSATPPALNTPDLKAPQPTTTEKPKVVTPKQSGM
jgi:hypothetical protein